MEVFLEPELYRGVINYIFQTPTGAGARAIPCELPLETLIKSAHMHPEKFKNEYLCKIKADSVIGVDESYSPIFTKLGETNFSIESPTDTSVGPAIEFASKNEFKYIWHLDMSNQNNNWFIDFRGTLEGGLTRGTWVEIGLFSHNEYDSDAYFFNRFLKKLKRLETEKAGESNDTADLINLALELLEEKNNMGCE